MDLVRRMAPSAYRVTWLGSRFGFGLGFGFGLEVGFGFGFGFGFGLAPAATPA